MKPTSPPLRHSTSHANPPWINSSTTKLTHSIAPATPAVVHRPPSNPQQAQALPLYATQASRMSDAPCVGRSALSPPRLMSIPTQTLLHSGPRWAPALTDSSGKDHHTQEERPPSPWPSTQRSHLNPTSDNTRAARTPINGDLAKPNKV